MRLWGGWLPFIGFKEHYFEDSTEGVEFLDNVEPPEGYYVDYHKITCFEIGWFGYGISWVTDAATRMRKEKETK